MNPTFFFLALVYGAAINQGTSLKTQNCLWSNKLIKTEVILFSNRLEINIPERNLRIPFQRGQDIKEFLTFTTEIENKQPSYASALAINQHGVQGYLKENAQGHSFSCKLHMDLEEIKLLNSITKEYNQKKIINIFYNLQVSIKHQLSSFAQAAMIAYANAYFSSVMPPTHVVNFQQTDHVVQRYFDASRCTGENKTQAIQLLTNDNYPLTIAFINEETHGESTSLDGCAVWKNDENFIYLRSKTIRNMNHAANYHLLIHELSHILNLKHLNSQSNVMVPNLSQDAVDSLTEEQKKIIRQSILTWKDLKTLKSLR